MIRSALVVLASLPSVALSQTAIQTDWSGGFGHCGPDSAWSGQFLSCHADWGQYIPGQVTLPLVLETYPAREHDHSGREEPLKSLDVLDLEMDGSLDLIAVDCMGDLVWFDNPDTGEWVWFSTPFYPGLSCREAIAADVTSDGFPEILGRSENALFLWRSTSPGEWVLHEIGPGLAGITDLETGDLDSDGYTDIAILQGGWQPGDSCCWFRNTDGSGTSWERVVITESGFAGRSLKTSDIDLDGDTDLFLTISSMYFGLQWCENLDGTGLVWYSHDISSPYSSYPVDLLAGDFDSDGDPDVLSSIMQGTTFLCRNQYLYWQGFICSEGSYDRVLEMADLENDGDWDAIGCCVNIGIHLLVNEDCMGSSWLNDSWYFGDSLPIACADLMSAHSGQECVFGANDENLMLYPLCFPGQYQRRGWLNSSVLYAGYNPDWQFLGWSAQTPPGTTIAFSARASDNPLALGDWSDSFTSPASLQGVLSPGASYFQYQVMLVSDDPQVTPVLEDVTVTWDDLSVGEAEEDDGEFLSIVSNPSAGEAEIQFGVGITGPVSLTVHDITGRVCRILIDGITCEGEYSAVIGDLPSGAYFARLTTSTQTLTRKLVLIR